jgi:SAM-dependent methyltransferase
MTASEGWTPRRPKLFREAHRILQPGGAIAIVTWIAEEWPFEPGRVFDELIAELGLERPPVAHAARPFHSIGSAAALLRRAGFKRVHATAGVVEHAWTLDSYLKRHLANVVLRTMLADVNGGPRPKSTAA